MKSLLSDGAGRIGKSGIQGIRVLQIFSYRTWRLGRAIIEKSSSVSKWLHWILGARGVSHPFHRLDRIVRSG